MKCKDCEACRKGYFKSKPDAYVCIGVKEPFIINDIEVQCTEYPERRTNIVKVANIAPVERAKAYVDDSGIYIPNSVDCRYHQLLISRELFVEAYNKWIKDTK